MNKINLLKENIRKQIYERQYLSNIQNSKYIIFNIDYGGFGAMVARRKLALQFGHYFNRTVIFNFIDHLYDDPFEEISNIKYEEIKNEKIVKFNYTLNQNDKVVFFDFNDYWNNSKIKNEYHEKSVDNLNFVEFSGLLLNFLKLKNGYQKLVDESIKKIKDNEPIIGIHIRRGDKEVESPYIPIERYLNELIKINKITNINKVFVTSDSDYAIEELKELAFDFTFIYDKNELRYNSKIANIHYARLNDENKKRETETCIKNIYMLSECTYIIGQSNAQFSKIALCKQVDKNNDINSYSLINPFNLNNVKWDH